MKKVPLLLFTFFCVPKYLFAQKGIVDKKYIRGKCQAISLNLNIPLLGYLKDVINIGIDNLFVECPQYSYLL